MKFKGGAIKNSPAGPVPPTAAAPHSGAGGGRSTSLPLALFDANCILRDLCLGELKQAGVRYHPVISSPELDNIGAAVDAGLAVALLPESSVLHASRVRPLNRDGLATHHVLTLNLIHASTLNREFLQPLAECIADAAWQSND